jgi:hypothetical protein
LVLAPCSALKRLWSECLDTLDRNLARIEQLEHLNLFSPSRDIMKPEPKPPNWEVLAGHLSQRGEWLLCRPGEGPWPP